MKISSLRLRACDLAPDAKTVRWKILCAFIARPPDTFIENSVRAATIRTIASHYFHSRAHILSRTRRLDKDDDSGDDDGQRRRHQQHQRHTPHVNDDDDDSEHVVAVCAHSLSMNIVVV